MTHFRLAAAALGLLSEILHARFEVKRVMKAAKHDQNLYRTGSLVDKTSPGIEDFSFRFGLLCSVLNRAGSCNARQFALKLVANVTYGYTSAGFSGRMPCAELVSAPKQSRSRMKGSTAVVPNPRYSAAYIVAG